MRGSEGQPWETLKTRLGFESVTNRTWDIVRTPFDTTPCRSSQTLPFCLTLATAQGNKTRVLKAITACKSKFSDAAFHLRRAPRANAINLHSHNEHSQIMWNNPDPIVNMVHPFHVNIWAESFSRLILPWGVTVVLFISITPVIIRPIITVTKTTSRPNATNTTGSITITLTTYKR